MIVSKSRSTPATEPHTWTRTIPPSKTPSPDYSISRTFKRVGRWVSMATVCLLTQYAATVRAVFSRDNWGQRNCHKSSQSKSATKSRNISGSKRTPSQRSIGSHMTMACLIQSLPGESPLFRAWMGATSTQWGLSRETTTKNCRPSRRTCMRRSLLISEPGQVRKTISSVRSRTGEVSSPLCKGKITTRACLSWASQVSRLMAWGRVW